MHDAFPDLFLPPSSLVGVGYRMAQTINAHEEKFCAEEGKTLGLTTGPPFIFETKQNMMQQDNAGQAAVRAAMKDAEAEVTDTYGMFVHTDDDGDDHHLGGQEDVDDHVAPDQTLTRAEAENGGSADVSRTVAV